VGRLLFSLSVGRREASRLPAHDPRAIAALFDELRLERLDGTDACGKLRAIEPGQLADCA